MNAGTVFVICGRYHVVDETLQEHDNQQQAMSMVKYSARRIGGRMSVDRQREVTS